MSSVLFAAQNKYDSGCEFCQQFSNYKFTFPQTIVCELCASQGARRRRRLPRLSACIECATSSNNYLILHKQTLRAILLRCAVPVCTFILSLLPSRPLETPRSLLSRRDRLLLVRVPPGCQRREPHHTTIAYAYALRN